jgi:hypothetical protein
LIWKLKIAKTFKAETTNGELSSVPDNVEFFRSLLTSVGVETAG